MRAGWLFGKQAFCAGVVDVVASDGDGIVSSEESRSWIGCNNELSLNFNFL